MKQITFAEIQPKEVCFKCGRGDKKLIHHHIRYDKGNSPEAVKFCCRSCHRKIHENVRKNNLCPLSVEETYAISTKLNHDSQHFKEHLINYRKTHKEIIAERNRKYREANKEKIRSYKAQFYQEHKEQWRRYDQERRLRKKLETARIP